MSNRNYLKQADKEFIGKLSASSKTLRENCRTVGLTQEFWQQVRRREGKGTTLERRCSSGLLEGSGGTCPEGRTL